MQDSDGTWLYELVVALEVLDEPVPVTAGLEEDPVPVTAGLDEEPVPVTAGLDEEPVGPTLTDLLFETETEPEALGFLLQTEPDGFGLPDTELVTLA